MEIIKSKTLPAVVSIKPEIYQDHRGESFETWNINAYNVIREIEWLQDNVSISPKNTLRGLHGDFKTWKLIQCLHGSIMFVVVDMQEDSKTYLQHEVFDLNDKNRLQVLVPAGFANGHLVLSDKCIFTYKKSALYSGQAAEFVVPWNDPKLGIPWPIKSPILSPRDSQAKNL